MDGCIFPYETRGVPPLFQCVCRRWHVWKPIPGLQCFLLSSLAPPLRGNLISFTVDFVADSQEDDYYVHEGP